MSDDDQKPRVFQLGTVPPPAGENDAYNAPTKVGPMAAQIQELINAATEEAERKNREQPATTAPPPLAQTTAPPPMATASVPPSSIPNDGRIPSIVPDDEIEGDGAYEDETRIAEGAYAMLADLPPSPRADSSTRGAPASSPPAAVSKTPVMPSAPPPIPSAPPPIPSAPPVEPAAPSIEPPAPPLELSALPVGPSPIIITEPLPVFDDVKPEPPLAAESDPATYSDPIAHTRPEWSSVSKSEPRLPVAAPAPNRMPLLIGLLVVVFGIAGIAFLIFGHR